MRVSPEPEQDLIPNPKPAIFDESNDPFGPEGVLYLDIECFSKFMEKPDNRMLSKPVIVRGVPWRILALCRLHQRSGAMNQRQPRGLALGYFLQCNNEDSLSKRGMWRCFGTATLEVLSVNGGENLSKKISHTFHNNEVDWGFTNFETFETLVNPENGYIENDTIRLKCHFTADVPTGSGYYWDSKSHAGCIGLRNQGATCYMNSILQAFYFTTGFRKAVYHMDVGTEPPESNICLAMQRVFYELQVSTEAVETNSLTRAFGWDKLDAFNQHDVQEFCRVLLDNLETKMKGTSEEQSIPKLFRGNMKSFIKCTDVEYESSRIESFYDVQLNVLGMESLERAFEAYTSVEVLDDDNKYDAGTFGLQRAEKGVKFVELPPVLHVQLMRFQYCGVEQKINERFTFPEQMNLEMCCELSKDLSKEDCIYSLHAVLVHSGEFHGGHYVTFINTNLHETTINPDVRPRWCKFDDDVVSRTTVEDAINSNFGGERSMNTSAYMLIYVRNNAIETVLTPIPDSEVPNSVVCTFELEHQQRNRIKKKKEEESMCIELPLIPPTIITQHHGFDLLNPEILRDPSITRETVLKTVTVHELYRIIEKRMFGPRRTNSNGSGMDIHDEDDDSEDDYDIDSYAPKFRLWKMAESYLSEKEFKSHASRFRPDQLLSPVSNEVIERALNSEKEAIYVEMPMHNEEDIAEYEFEDNILCFIKFYDSTSQTFNLLGHLIVDHRRPIATYRDNICKMAGLPPGTKLLYYEELAADLIEPMHTDKANDHEFSSLFHEEDGAIIVVEQADLATAQNNVRVKMEEMYRTAEIEFHETVFNKGNDNKEINDAEIKFVKKVRLDYKLCAMTEQIGKELNVDPKNVLIWTKMYTGRCEPCCEDYTLVTSQIALGRNFTHDPRKCKRYISQYSIMPFPVSEMSKRLQMKIFAMNSKMEVDEITVWPMKNGVVSNILDEARRYFTFAEGGTGKLRLVQVGTNPNYHRLYQIYPENHLISDIEAKYLYRSRVEEIPADEIEIAQGEFFCPVVHFDREPTNRMFGAPFFIKVKNGELMTDVRERLRKKLGDVSDAEFAKYKFALLSRDKICRYIEFGDSDKVNLQDMSIQTTGNKDERFAVPQVYIGIDHKSPVIHTNENSIRILN